MLRAEHGDIEDIDSYRTKLRHDLRTPINAVKGYGEMIMEDARDGGHDALLPDLEKLLAAADGMLARIDALVAFSGQTLDRPRRGRGILRRCLARARCAEILAGRGRAVRPLPGRSS